MTNSATRRDFPTPGSPRTMTTRLRRRCDACFGQRREVAQLLVAPDECRCVSRRRSAQAVDPVADEPLLLAFERQGLGRFAVEGIGHLLPGRCAHDDLVRCGRAAQARRGVDGVAGQREVARPRIGAPRHDQAGRDAGVHRQASGQVRGEGRQVGVDRGMQLERRRDGTARIVPARDRNAEKGHDLVADELVHRAALALDDGARFRLDAGHQRFDLLRVEALVERRVAAEIGEHDGGVAPLAFVRRAGGRWGGGDVGAAAGAKALAVEDRGAARRAGRADRRPAKGAEPGAGRDFGLAAGTRHRRSNSCEAS